MIGKEDRVGGRARVTLVEERVCDHLSRNQVVEIFRLVCENYNVYSDF